MGRTDRTTAMEFLSQEECWRLLAERGVGRLGVATKTGPEVYPINYALDGEAIVFRTDPGGKLAALAGNPAVCFQIDEIDPGTRTGWSVLVKGTAHQLGPDERERAQALDLEYWAVGPKDRWVRIDAEEITGRRLWVATVPADRPPDIDFLDDRALHPDRPDHPGRPGG